MNKKTAANQGGIERIILPVALNFQVGESGLPERIDLVPAGKRIVGWDGRAWNNPDPQAIVDRVKSKGVDLVLDFVHATQLKASNGEHAPAAAWLSDLKVESDGRITAAVNSWTPEGEKAVRNREYRYISPALLYDPRTMIVRDIVSAGLTNTPNLPLQALNQMEEHTMDPLLKKILAKLGLPEDAAEETALNAVGKLQTDLQTALNSAQTPPLDKFVPKADYELALNRAATAEARIAQGEKDKLEGEIETAINQALTEGKIAPASKEFYTAVCRIEGGVEQFKKFLATAPFLVADSGLDGKKPEGERTALNADQTAIMNMFGNTAEDLAKYGK